MEQESAEYSAFVEKFKPKKTTDDCYTPDNVYNAVADWVASEYGIERERMVRPFWPGANYKAQEYPQGCVVVDNPPFSLLSKIIRFYQAEGVPFFLFSPLLTLFSNSHDGICCICTDNSIIYENGANVKTAFITNLEACKIRTAPELYKAIDAANRENSKAKKLPRYSFPYNVATSTRMGAIGRNTLVKIPEGVRVARLDEMEKGKKLFGYGFIVGDEAAAIIQDIEERRETKLTDFYNLSERERRIAESLGGVVRG